MNKWMRNTSWLIAIGIVAVGMGCQSSNPPQQISWQLGNSEQTVNVSGGREDINEYKNYPENRGLKDNAWMQVDTIHHALIGFINVAGEMLVDTLTHYEPEQEIYPKRVYSIAASDSSTVYLFIYSRGHLLYWDEALTCVIGEDGLKPVALFSIDGQRDSVISCMWYDQLVEASEGFPYDSLDEDRFGLHYNQYTKRLYAPILDSHDPDSEFANTSCMQYTGRYDILLFNGKEFEYTGTDGAWWLLPELRGYKRTVSNKRMDCGIEQIDLMFDGTFRRALWKGAKTLDDLQKKPDKINVSRKNNFVN